METTTTSCFLASKASSKTMAVVLSPTGGFAKPRPRLLFGGRRATTCCSSVNARGASSEDGGGGAAPPAIDPDWRSFRAQLYFNEQHANPNPNPNPNRNPGAVTTTTTVVPMPPPQQSAKKKVVGDRWAHPLAEPEKGCLLVATEKLDGSHIFERTVILLLSSGGAGARQKLGPVVGVILNRPSLMSIKEAAETIFADDADIAAAFAGRPLFFGGPLEECFFLLGPRATATSAAGSSDVVARTGLFEEVMPGLHYGTRETVGCAAELAKRGVVGVRDFRFFDGFCGWEREQLRDEVRAGLWHVAACSAAVLGLATVVKGGLWEEVQGLVGHRERS